MTDAVRRDSLLLTRLAAVISFGALIFYYRQGAILLYGDAVAHINIARRVIDSRTPGLFQLGTVWLPLPHVLNIPFVANDRRPGDVFCFQSNGFPSCDAPDDAQSVKGQVLFLAKADHDESLCGNRTFGRREEYSFSAFAYEFPAIPQRREQTTQFFIRVLRRPLIGISRGFMFEQANELQIRRLRVGADHFDGKRDAVRPGPKNVFLWSGLRIGSRAAERKQRAGHS